MFDMDEENLEELAHIPKRVRNRVPSLRSILTVTIVILMVYLFVFGHLQKFYLSLLFFYYSILGEMWWAVIGIGVTQTLLLIPLRIIRISNQAKIGEFKERVEELEIEEQRFFVKKSAKSGQGAFLFYSADFVIQLATYLSIGRMFLMDFYNYRLDPNLLYQFVPYPEYPIEGTIFKLPYPWFAGTRSFGWEIIVWVWLIIVLLQVIVLLVRYFYTASMKKSGGTATGLPKNVTKYASGYLIMFLFISWVLMKNFPTDWSLRFFSGSITIPNPTFNSVTAVMTFLTLIWFGVNRIRRDSIIAREKGIDEKHIATIQRSMFGDNFRSAVLVGLGAFFITNQIPSAFELSIFTLEMISLISPLTLDPLIFRSVKRVKN